MSVARFAYSLLWYVATPLLLLRLLWRARRQPEYLDHVAERFGFYRGAVDAGPWIWVHAVSVGETRAAAPLIRALQARYRGHRILLTHMTPTGRETGAVLFGDEVLQCYLPYDQPGAVARFLGRFRPVDRRADRNRDLAQPDPCGRGAADSAVPGERPAVGAIAGGVPPHGRAGA
jgi:3-deoxy-D-manno-octulosonic-acid transferase